MTVPSSVGSLTIPQSFNTVALNGRQSKVILTDYSFGSRSNLLYSTASVFFAGTIGGRDVLFLFGDEDQDHEFSFSPIGKDEVRSASSTVKFTEKNGHTLVSVLAGSKGLVTIWESESQIVLFSDPVTAGSFWAPAIPSEQSSSPLKNFWQFGTNTTALIGGPYLVRNATLSRSGELALRGDLNASTLLTVIASPEVRSVSWNGFRVPTDFVGSSRSGVIRTGHLSLSKEASGITVPKLTNWKFADSLPEVQSGFSDEKWVVADHTTTNITAKPKFGDGRILYGTFITTQSAVFRVLTTYS